MTPSRRPVAVLGLLALVVWAVSAAAGCLINPRASCIQSTRSTPETFAIVAPEAAVRIQADTWKRMRTENLAHLLARIEAVELSASMNSISPAL
jgi:hypothetical protein